MQVGALPDYIMALTSQWEGDLLDDGRPYVPGRILERLKKISMEEVWGILRNQGYNNQYQGDWMIINPDYPVMTGSKPMISQGFANFPLDAPGLGIELNEDGIRRRLIPDLPYGYFEPTPEWDQQRSHDRTWS